MTDYTRRTSRENQEQFVEEFGPESSTMYYNSRDFDRKAITAPTCAQLVSLRTAAIL